MSFYGILKAERLELVEKIHQDLLDGARDGNAEVFDRYFGDADTYKRKVAYEAAARIYLEEPSLAHTILGAIELLLEIGGDKARQSAVHALGEIGRVDSGKIMPLLERSLGDASKAVQNAVIGALKRMGERNPVPTLRFARKFLHHPDPAIRREIVHGIELRGRTHPDDVVPLVAELQDEANGRVKKMIIHVVSQCSYKKGCLEKVLGMLHEWYQGDIVNAILQEIIEVHIRYSKFSEKSVDQATQLIREHFPLVIRNYN